MAGCPVCRGKEGFEWIYTLLICADCRALLNDTPFGIKLVMKDAADRYPEILEWWDRRYDLTEEEMIKYGFV